MTLTRRAHILFEEDSYSWLKQRAERENSSVGEVVRKAVERERFGDVGRRRAAGEAILSAKPMPVDDWEVMERELQDSMYGKTE